MKIKIMFIVTTFLLSFHMSSFASNEQERVYLIQIINQLNAMKPLIVAAAREQPKKNRIRFHYTAYRDVNGRTHPGLLEDMTAIKKGIEEKLNQLSTQPHTFQPIQGDYVNHVSERKITW